MIVTINGKDTWRPNFVMAREPESCREFFTEIYGVDFYGCDDYGLPETEMAKLADAIREEFYDAAKYICDKHGLDAESFSLGPPSAIIETQCAALPHTWPRQVSV